ncbi:MAG: hypothetical protein ACM3SY_04485 [Candidatus Omnitrophota bacterium]
MKKNLLILVFLLICMVGFNAMGYTQEPTHNTIEKARNIGKQKEVGENVGFQMEPGSGPFFIRFIAPYETILLITLNDPVPPVEINLLDKDQKTVLKNFKQGQGNQIQHSFLEKDGVYYMQVNANSPEKIVVQMKVQAFPKDKYPNGIPMASESQTQAKPTQTPQTVDQTQTPPAQGSNMTLFVIIGLIAVILVVIIVILIKRKK